MKLETFFTTVFKTLALVLVLVVLLPSAVKFSHAFTHHSHYVCEDDNSLITHFHEADLDCDFYKFKLTTQYYFQNEFEIIDYSESNFKLHTSQYQFVSNFQKLQISLRGPPQLI